MIACAPFRNEMPFDEKLTYMVFRKMPPYTQCHEAQKTSQQNYNGQGRDTSGHCLQRVHVQSNFGAESQRSALR